MFIGHFALAFGAKKAAPSVSLGTLFLSAQLADLVWPTLVLLGVETVEVHPGMTAFTPLEFVSYPYSHSLVALLAWATAFAGLWATFRRRALSAGLVVAALVLSHWVLDVLTHRPDMPLTIGGPARLGLGLWNSVPGTIVVEALLFAIGVGLYARETEAIDRTGHIGLWALVAFLVIVYCANILGSPPPSSAAVAWVTESMWLLVAWAWWVDRHRRTRGDPV
jgi:hypothetical protein